MSTRIRQRLLSSAAVVLATAAAWLAILENTPATRRPIAPPVAPAEPPVVNGTLGRPSTAEDLTSAPASARTSSEFPTDSPRNESSLVAAAYELARNHPAEAARRLLTLQASAERDAALIHAVGQWATVDLREARKWAMALPSGELREEVCGSVAAAWADKEPRAAADWVATEMSEGFAQRNAAVAVAQRWVQVDPASAAAWALQFPAADLRRDALDALLRIWLNTNPGAVEQWTNTNESGSLQETREILAAIRAEPK